MKSQSVVVFILLLVVGAVYVILENNLPTANNYEECKQLFPNENNHRTTHCVAPDGSVFYADNYRLRVEDVAFNYLRSHYPFNAFGVNNFKKLPMEQDGKTMVFKYTFNVDRSANALEVKGFEVEVRMINGVVDELTYVEVH